MILDLEKNIEAVRKAQAIGNLGIWRYDVKANRTKWSIAAYRIFGIPEGTPLNFEVFIACVHPEDRDYLQIRWKQMLEEGFMRHTYRIVVDGKVKWVSANAEVYYNDQNEPFEIVGYTQDITEKKLIELELEKYTNLLERAQEIGRIGVWYHDLINDQTTWTKENYKILSAQEDEELNFSTFIQRIHPDDQQLFKEKWEEGIQTGVYEVEFRLIINDELSWVRDKGEVKYDENGNAISVSGFIQDITNQKMMERRLSRDRELLEEINEDKDRLISVMAHDLINPFNSLLGYSSLLSSRIDRYDKDTIKERVKLIDDLANRTYMMLHDTLQWLKIQNGRLAYYPTSFELIDRIADELEILNNQAAIKNISIQHSGFENIKVFTDEKMLLTVFRNLVSNAIKFTNDGGEIQIKAERKDHHIEISISDNGVGINSEYLENLFDLSYFRSTKGTNNETGSGFGLMICEEFINRIGGEIWARSNQGNGSIFYFTIPLNKNEEQAPSKSVSLKGGRQTVTILIAEDDLNNFNLLATLIQDELHVNCNIIHAMNGKEAVQLFQSNWIDLVLMDIKMPVMDGFMATEEIRKNDPDAIIIFQSANDDLKHIERAKKLGSNDFVVKPLKIGTLKAILSKYQIGETKSQ